MEQIDAYTADQFLGFMYQEGGIAAFLGHFDALLANQAERLQIELSDGVDLSPHSHGRHSELFQEQSYGTLFKNVDQAVRASGHAEQIDAIVRELQELNSRNRVAVTQAIVLGQDVTQLEELPALQEIFARRRELRGQLIPLLVPAYVYLRNIGYTHEDLVQ